MTHRFVDAPIGSQMAPFIDWFLARKAKRLTAVYLAGYQWAAGEMLSKRLTSDQVLTQANAAWPGDSDQGIAFDTGAVAAAVDYERLRKKSLDGPR